LQAELLALAHLEGDIIEPLADGCRMRFAGGIEADRMFSAAWRQLTAAQPSLEQAYGLLGDAAAQRELRASSTSLLAAVEVIHDLRVAAVRALGEDPSLVPVLRLLHSDSMAIEIGPMLRSAVGLDALRTEIELTLARQGDRELLEARISTLRLQVEKAAGADVNVSARVTTRPDISARNEVAHLLLRSGDAAGAEAEWLVVIGLARETARNPKDLRRASVASLLGSVYYNLACAQSLQLKLTRASESLESARLNGYRDFNWMLEDGDLDALRHTPDFRAWFRKVAPPAAVDRLDAGSRAVPGAGGAAARD
jgi:hypothetical protein